MKIEIKEKKLELKSGVLNVYYSKEFQNSFYKQFNNKKLFGCNFNDGTVFSEIENNISAYCFDHKSLNFCERLGYFNNCFNFDNTKVDVDINYSVDGAVVTSYLLNKFVEYKYSKDYLIISNMYDTHLGTLEKIIYIKKLQELISAGYTVIILTNDLILFKLLGIDINLFIEDTKEIDLIDQLIESYNTTKFYNILSNATKRC